jgi:putative intracellular protease/amidase
MAPKKYGVVLFNGFQALDVFGPVDALNFLSKETPLEMSIIAQSLDPVSTLLENSDLTIGQSIVPTHTFDNAPDDIEVLLVPGGIGTRRLELTQPVVDFVKQRYPKLKFLLTVCTGSALTARAGVMEGKKATSNKRGFDWVSQSKFKTRISDWYLDCDIITTESGHDAGAECQLGAPGKMGPRWQHMDRIWSVGRHRHDLRLCRC